MSKYVNHANTFILLLKQVKNGRGINDSAAVPVNLASYNRLFDFTEEGLFRADPVPATKA